MNEPAAGGPSAGALLRAAREEQGLHIAALAAAIKVTPRKLDALENDRWDELPDATFTRALAQTVCRFLKIDAAPVLDRLPHTDTTALDPGLAGLNMPFRGRASRDESAWSGSAVRPLMLAALLLMAAALVVFFLPQGLISPTPSDPSPTVIVQPPAQPAASGVEFVPTPFAAAPDAPAPPADAAASQPAAAASAVVAAAPASASAPAPATAASATATFASADGVVQLRTSSPSWIQVRDADGKVLLSRTVNPDEKLGLDGTPPFKLIIGNAAATQVGFRGQPVDLAPRSRENVARFELP